MTTFLSYGQVAQHRQGEILKQLAVPQQVMETDVYEFMKAMMEKSQQLGIKI